MFIDKIFNIDKICSFDEPVAEYLATHGLPLLAIENGKFIFRKTKELEKILKKMPIVLKNKKKGGG